MSGRTHSIADVDESVDEDPDWRVLPEAKAMELAQTEDTHVGRKLGLTWKNLTVKGLAADASFNENIISQFIPEELKRGSGMSKASLRTIIDDSHGCVNPGEMLLVLGRPGAGCTTLLKVLANRRKGYKEIGGWVNYGSLDHKAAAKYRGQIVMNTEEETFFPTLTTGQTMDFATRMKVPYTVPAGYRSRDEARVATKEFFLHLLGMTHTTSTKVGNEFIRGVSGGERSRVSILETMANRGSIYCWDNSTRGLDASTALQYVKAVRQMTDLFGLASVVRGRRQCGRLLNRYCRWHPSHWMYTNSTLGVTVPTERKIREGHGATFPRTANDILAHYEKSDVKKQMKEEYDYPETDKAQEYTLEFEGTIKNEKHPGFLTKRSPVTVGFGTQLMASIQR